MNILLGVTGGVAAFKSASIVRLLTEKDHQVRVVATENALRFIGETTLANLSKNKVNVDLYSDTEEGAHIELADWAEKILIAPATASLLGRLANGIATDLLTNVVMASSAPVTIAPAMHSNMYTNQATISNMQKLSASGINIIEPDVGRLSGADTGIGRLPEPEDIVRYFLGGPLSGIKVAVTLGGTQEPIDSVRYLGNRSSGKQGLAFAKELRNQGAEVTVIAAHVDVDLRGFNVVWATTHQQMKDELENLKCDVLVMSAAISDFTVDSSNQKLPRTQDQQLTLIPTEDLVKNFKQSNPQTLVFGFSVSDSSSDWLSVARQKKSEKNLDFLFANTTEAFGEDSNSGYLLGKHEVDMSGSKIEIAKLCVAEISKQLLK
ncbi:MAG: bifunctional phosphopantothenoylcysteine decarboxylase/phosphopantothenate--cysteine ligase CoaBC [Microbacteriaceae bacterium]|nr:bifunctional phosphopantothenoylcysteine decarboxylase/phosphopantothenate--cysteine ligase CoaBC [Microbacteriaceae bacterium]